MPDFVVKFIPADYKFAPDYLAATKGKELLCELLPDIPKGGISFTTSPNPCLIDNDGNLDSIHCPHCNEYVSSYWWREAVSDAYRDDFWELSVSMPCCGKTASLNELDYHPHLGFSRFVLEVHGSIHSDIEHIPGKLSELYGQPFCCVPVRV